MKNILVSYKRGEFMTRWIFLGDDSRWKFVGWLLKRTVNEIPGKGRITILIRHGNVEYQELEEEGGLVIVTYHSLPLTEIFVPAYSDDMQLSLEKFDRCALFETHPLGRESTENLATLLESGKTEPMMLFVLMDLIDEIDYEPLVDAKLRKVTLDRKGRDVMIARGVNDVLDILHWHRPLVSDLRRRIQHELKLIRNQIEHCGETYEEYISNWRENGCLSQEVKNEITAFKNVKGRPHIWKCYNETAQKILFPKAKTYEAGIYGAIDLYKKILYNPNEQGKNLAAFIWNVDADLKQLLKKFFDKFNEAMTSPKKYHDFLTSDESGSEHIYLSLVNKPGGRFFGIKEEFFGRYEQFVCKDVLRIMKTELEDHIEKLRGMVK